nr:unnamed protein product [Spirometra erinaceieuropaei]
MIKGQNVLKSKTLLSKEISVLRDLNHEHIVRLYDHSISNTGVYLVIEFCNGGDLSEYLHLKKTLPEETIRHFLIQIGSAMDAMNKRAIMHRDLKPGNILLSFYGNFSSVGDVPGHLITFKLADFGFARFLQDGIMAETMCGSPMYMAPEVLMCRKYDARADIWSMGVIVYQCFVGRAPFYANSPEALKNIYEKTVDLKPKIPHETSANLRDLLLNMLIRKPSARIDFPAFLAHPFLQAKRVSPSDLVQTKPASAPPLPSSFRRGVAGGTTATYRTSHTTSGKSYGQVANRTYRTPALPLRDTEKPSVREPPVSRIAALMPNYAHGVPGSQGWRASPPNKASCLSQPAVFRRQPLPPSAQHLAPGASKAQPAPPPYWDHEKAKSGNPSAAAIPDPLQTSYGSQTTDTSEASLTPTDDQGDGFIEDGLGGSSFLCAPGDQYREQGGGDMESACALSTSGYGGLEPCLTGVLHGQRGHQPTALQHPGRNEPGNERLVTHADLGHSCSGARLEGYVIVNSDGSEIPPDQHHFAAARHSLRGLQPPVYSGSNSNRTFKPQPIAAGRRSQQSPIGVQPIAVGSPSKLGHVALRSVPTNEPTDSGDQMKRSLTPPETFPNAESPRLKSDQQAATRGSLMPVRTSPETVEERHVESGHTEEVKTITMVLELCELLAELAERRASALTDCTAAGDQGTTSDDGDEGAEDSAVNVDGHDCAVNRGDQSGESDSSSSTPTRIRKRSKRLQFAPEAKRIVEQMVLYRRILYYLEYIYVQVKKAVDNKRLKPTVTAKRRLVDCNALYHRCYIRLCQLARQSRRVDLIEPVGRLLSRITANRLIFNHALDQCCAAEMDDYIGELGLCLQRYRAAITLIHGLCQHAKSPSDKALLSDCLRLIRDRFTKLWRSAVGDFYSTETTGGALQDPASATAVTSSLVGGGGGSPPNILTGLCVGGGVHPTGRVTTVVSPTPQTLLSSPPK